LTLNTFTRAGYSFSGWNTNAGGTGTAYADGALYPFSANVTLYAQWTALTNPPGDFSKISPANSATGVATNPTLSWGTSSGAISYEYCYATSSGCTSWIPVGTATSVGLTGLSKSTLYYWQVKAVNASGNTLADTGAYWSFITAVEPTSFTITVITNAIELATDTAIGQSYQVTFSVMPIMGGTPTGNVTVSDGTDSCVGTVASGMCNLLSTTVGAKLIIATYAGDSNFLGSISIAVPHTVIEAPARNHWLYLPMIIR
jgi:uncharacterized repeat protein (TIGR02543 family)